MIQERLIILLSFDSVWLNFHPSLELGVGLIIIYLGLLILTAEALNRFFNTSVEFTRKIVHIGSGHVILLAWWFDLPPWVMITAAAIASVMSMVAYFVPILPSINSVGRKSLGTFFYAISFGVLVDWFWWLDKPEYAAIGMLVMAWGDGMAAIIGQNFGKHPYTIFGNNKSWEGSLTMILASFMVTSLILGFMGGNLASILIIALITAFVATVLESVSQLGIDNLTVPLVSGGLSFLLVQWLL